MTSVLVGASRKSQLVENVTALANLHFEAAELAAIDRDPGGPGLGGPVGPVGGNAWVTGDRAGRPRPLGSR